VDEEFRKFVAELGGAVGTRCIGAGVRAAIDDSVAFADTNAVGVHDQARRDERYSIRGRVEFLPRNALANELDAGPTPKDGSRSL